jgi:hypothetical protein
MERYICILSSIVLLFFCSESVYATEISDNVKVMGSLHSTVIDVVVPIESVFKYDPNYGTLTKSPITILNKTNSPVYVKLVDIQLSKESLWKPSFVEPDYYSEEKWNNLTKKETKEKISIGLKAIESKNWLFGIENQNVWSTIEQPRQQLGVIKNKKDVVLEPILKSGNSLPEIIDLQVNFVFEFGLP